MPLNLVLYLKSDCMACKEAIQVCEEFVKNNSFHTKLKLNKVDLSNIKPGDTNYFLYAGLYDRLPVVELEGEEISSWGITKEQLSLSLNRWM